MKKVTILVLLLVLMNFAFGKPVEEPIHLKNLRREIRIEGCTAGLMYYIRGKTVTPDMIAYCERVVEDAVFMYEFTETEKIVPIEQNFKRDDIKI